MKSIVLALLAGLVISGSAFAEAEVAIGTGFGHSVFIENGKTVSDSHVLATAQVTMPLDDGDWDAADETYYPNWYLGVAYGITGQDNPVQGIALPVYRRAGGSNVFIGAGPQFEFWSGGSIPFNRFDLDRDPQEQAFAFGGRLEVEMWVTDAEVPVRFLFSMTKGADGLERIELGLSGMPQFAGF